VSNNSPQSAIFLIENTSLHPEGGTVEIQSSSEGYYLYVNVQASALPQHLSISLSVFGGLISLAPIGLEALD